MIELHGIPDVSDGQTPLPQDERGEFLRAVHGGACHPARQASVRVGHCRVCQPTPEVCCLSSCQDGCNLNLAVFHAHVIIFRATLRKLRAENMFETWVSRVAFITPMKQPVILRFNIIFFFLYKHNFQEDDMDGIHIVAFAEEEDPGLCVCCCFFFLTFSAVVTHKFTIAWRFAPRRLRVPRDP